jgi:anthranilate phosphoribosyltransferase
VHPFAEFVRILGRGKKGSRSLSRAEACSAFKMILAGDVEDVQLGAFLMLLRVKEETGEEIAGFVDAVRESYLPNNAIDVDFDIASYAGKRRHLPWYILAALCLADAGYRVFMHGSRGHTKGRLYTEDVFSELGIPIATNWKEANDLIDQHNLCFFPLEHLCSPLQRIIELRPLLGLRSPVHTLSRLLNPTDAKALCQGIFHPAYNGIHQTAAKLLNYPQVMVIRGEGGEFERNPESKLTAYRVSNGEETILELEPLLTKRTVKPESLSVDDLVSVWKGEKESVYPIQAILGTLQLALMARHPELNPQQALERASTLWQQRTINRLG